MSNKVFYSSTSYRVLQSQRTRANWLSGRMDFLRKRKISRCERSGCGNTFSSIPSENKRYCSRACAATVNNSNRKLSIQTREKIRAALAGRTYPGRFKAPPKFSICLNPKCRKQFMLRFWRPSDRPIKYCSRMCAIKDVGGRPTSPRAARALAGVRLDISRTIYFFSRWEANYARLMNFLGIKWVHQPRTFELLNQRYTPDFYLPETGTYVEIKNYLSPYSKRRDEEFRALYPDIPLRLILKEEYLKLQAKYAQKIPKWEHTNAKRG